MEIATIKAKIYEACVSAKQTVSENPKATIATAVTALAIGAAYCNRDKIMVAAYSLMNRVSPHIASLKEQANAKFIGTIAYASAANQCVKDQAVVLKNRIFS